MRITLKEYALTLQEITAGPEAANLLLVICRQRRQKASALVDLKKVFRQKNGTLVIACVINFIDYSFLSTDDR